MNEEKHQTKTMKWCPRCGEAHEGVEVNKLVSPVIIGNDNEHYPYVYQCPKTHRPVYLKKV